MNKTLRIVASAAMSMMAVSAMADPVLVNGTTLSIYDQRAPSAGGAQIGNAAVANVATERDGFVQKLAAGYQTDDLSTAPYKVQENFSQTVPYFSAVQVTAPFSVFSGGSLTPDGLGGSFVDTLLTQPLTSLSGGRYDPTSGACTADPAEQAEIEACTSRWIETSSKITIDFGGAYGAFGFYGTDFGDFSGRLKMELLDDQGQAVFEWIYGDLDRNTNAALGFFGFLDTQTKYHGVAFTVLQEGALDYFGFDDLILGQVDGGGGGTVPEPGSLALIGASLLALSATRRRRAGKA